MNPIPAARHAASVPPTVVAPTAPWTIAAARSRGPPLRASAVKRPSSSSVRPIRSSPSRTPIVAGTRARLAHAPLALEPDLDALARREAVRDERRLERDHRVARSASASPTSSEIWIRSVHGIAPSCATQRAAAASASSGPPTRKPAANASPAPVVSTDLGRKRRAAPRRRSGRRSEPRFSTHVAALRPGRRDPLLGLVREDDRRSERLQPLAEALRPEVSDRAPGERSTLTRGASSAARERGSRRSARAGASSRDVQPVAAVEPGRVELVGREARARRRGRRPSSARRPPPRARRRSRCGPPRQARRLDAA